MGSETDDRELNRDFWSVENMRYAAPHFRLHRIAKLVNGIARGRACTLLDVGCGPAALAPLLEGNIRYFGIDIAIQRPAPNFAEVDLTRSEIPFEGQTFDLVVASGFFEYVGGYESQILEKIHGVLKPDGALIVSYINFEHIHCIVTPHYSNIRTIGSFKDDLRQHFEIKRSFPVSYNWRGTAPRRRVLTGLEMHFDVDIPMAGRFLGVEYLFVCAPRLRQELRHAGGLT